MKTITIAPLSTPASITSSSWDAISNAKKLYLQTAQHPSARPVLESGLSFVSMDDLYESSADFDVLNHAIAERLTSGGSCVYAVLGDGCFAQLPVIRQLAEERGFQISVMTGVSYAKAAFPEIQDAMICTARTMPMHPDTSMALCVQELDNPIIAGEIKLALLNRYPDDWNVTLATMQKNGDYKKISIPLCELDRQRAFSAGSVLYVPPVPFFSKSRYNFEDLVYIMRRLRAPDGCPWDRAQTHSSIKRDLIEECYELNDAIDEQDDAHIIEELGDVLMLIVFHSAIADEQGRFTEQDVTDAIVKKMIFRHPHVFGSDRLSSQDEVLVKWDELKRKEKQQKTYSEVLCSVPKGFPALMRCEKIQKKAGKIGFDWHSAQDALPKISEELEELKTAIASESNIGEEAGDLLFAVVNVIRHLGLNAEQILHDASDKFIERFSRMEELAAEDGIELEDLPLQEQDVYWEKAKKCPKHG